MKHCQRMLAVLLSTIAIPVAVVGQTDEAAPTNFNEHVKPILRQHCLKCHGDDKQESDLNLQGYGSLLRGGSGGKVVEAGRSVQSILFQAITNPDEDARMPPNSPPLPKGKIDLIRKWIDTGLRDSANSRSMVKTRDLKFTPAASAGAKANGPPAMPADLASVERPKLARPFPVLAMDAGPWALLVAVADQDHVRFIHSGTEKELGRAGTRAIDVYPRLAGDTSGPQFGDQFFETFGRSSRNTICACETKKEPTLSQALHLAVGDTLRSRLGANGKIKQLVETTDTPEGVIEELFIFALSRRPTAAEQRAMQALVGDAGKDPTVYEDILWGLLNSTEFAFNH